MGKHRKDQRGPKGKKSIHGQVQKEFGKAQKQQQSHQQSGPTTQPYGKPTAASSYEQRGGKGSAGITHPPSAGRQQPSVAASAASNPSNSVYKRVPQLPTKYPKLGTNDFVYPSNPQFEKILSTSYQGFVLENTSDYGAELDTQFQNALEALDAKGYYQFDMTQPAGLNTKVARTFVTRALVGDPGITYKYLGLRMFAYPWTPGAVGNNESFTEIHKLNQIMIERSERLAVGLRRPQVGSSKYNLTLINRCFPEADIKLKKEPLFEKDFCSVSWHADSSLEHYSSIGIYHFHRPGQGASHEKPWKAALRVYPNAEGPQQGKQVPEGDSFAPAVAMSFPPQCIYYMLDDFNHHHQHAVLAGSTHRFASTHRVSLREGHCFEYIEQRCQHVLAEKLSGNRKYLRKVLLLLVEVEFEWLRQFFIQGETHRALHEWWHEPMKQLQDLYQQAAGRMTAMIRAMKAAAAGGFHKSEETVGSSLRKKIEKHMREVEAGCFDEVVEQLKEIYEKRAGWEARERDPIYASCDPAARPIPASSLACFQEAATLAKEWGCTRSGNDHLLFLIDLVKTWQTAFTTRAK